MAHRLHLRGSKLRIRASAKNAADPLRNREFDLVAYTGGKLELDNWKFPLVIAMDGIETISETPPALYGHNEEIDETVGYASDLRVEANQLRVKGVLTPTAEGDRASQIIAKHDKGYRWQISIGAKVTEKEFVPLGRTCEVNGQKFEGPLFIGHRSILSEVSFVVLGADERTSARIAARRVRGRASTAKAGGIMSFEDWLKSLGIDPATATAELLSFMQSAYDRQQAAAAEGGEGEDDANAEGTDDEDDANAEGDGTEDERKLSSSRGRKSANRVIQRATNRNVSATAKRRAAEYRRIAEIEAKCSKHPKILAQALEEGWSADRAELEVVRASRAPVPHPQGGANPEKPNVTEAALLLSVGMKEQAVGRFFDQNTMNSAVEARNRGVSLHSVMDDVIRASGSYYSGDRKTESFVKAAMAAERTVRASSNFTGVSLANLLENVAEKTLKVGYDSQEAVWPLLCDIASNNNFKPTSRVRLDSKGAFQKVGPDGELKHAGLSDAKYSTQLETWGTIIALTRKMQIDDDLNSFLSLPDLLGRMGKLSIEEEYFKLLLSNEGAFFHADHRNLLSGAAYALSIGAITAAEEKFANQVDANNKPILTPPKIMLVGTNQKAYAESIFKESVVNETTTTDKPKPATNPHAGKFSVVSSPYVNNAAIRDRFGAAIAGQTQTGWWLFADPKRVAALVVAFLNGQQSPTIESAETSFDTLGMQWRAYHDAAVGYEDQNGAVFVNGVG